MPSSQLVSDEAVGTHTGAASAPAPPPEPPPHAATQTAANNAIQPMPDLNLVELIAFTPFVGPRQTRGATASGTPRRQAREIRGNDAQHRQPGCGWAPSFAAHSLGARGPSFRRLAPPRRDASSPS